MTIVAYLRRDVYTCPFARKEGNVLPRLTGMSKGRPEDGESQDLLRHPISSASMVRLVARQMILDAITTHPEDAKAVAMVATDAVYFTSPGPAAIQRARRMG